MDHVSGLAPTGVVDSIFQLRNFGVPLPGTRVCVLGYHGPESPGGGWFTWDTESTLVDDGGTIIASSERVKTGRWIRQQDGPVSPLWFGALGDNSGRTPHEDRKDPHTLPKPFSVEDSWDSIGLQLALRYLEQHGRELLIPAGTYRLTFPLAFRAKGRATLKGAGSSLTTLTRDLRRFTGGSALLMLEDVVGMPTTIKDICLRGEGGENQGLTLISARNVAGVRLEDCWLAHAKVGLEFQEGCEDWAVRSCTIEACDLILSVSEGSWGVVEGNDFWQTTADESYVGIRNLGNLICNDNQFMGFQGFAIDSQGEVHVSGNYFDSPKGHSSVRAGKGTIEDNAFSFSPHSRIAS